MISQRGAVALCSKSDSCSAWILLGILDVPASLQTRAKIGGLLRHTALSGWPSPSEGPTLFLTELVQGGDFAWRLNRVTGELLPPPPRKTTPSPLPFTGR